MRFMVQPESVTSSIQDYAKAVYALEARAGGAVSTNDLAERLGVTPGSVSAMLRKLSDVGLLEHEPYHGGGWACGDLDTHEQPCRMLARSSGACVLSVDYRLAPEHPFPAAVDDALAVFRDAVARAEELRVDPERIAVAGDSAGGHLAAVTCQLSAADEGPAPAFQLLIYPATDFSREAPSRLLFAEGFILTKEDMDWYEEHFLTSSSDRSDPRLSPLLAEDLSGVAPALVRR